MLRNLHLIPCIGAVDVTAWMVPRQHPVFDTSMERMNCILPEGKTWIIVTCRLPAILHRSSSDRCINHFRKKAAPEEPWHVSDAGDIYFRITCIIQMVDWKGMYFTAVWTPPKNPAHWHESSDVIRIYSASNIRQSLSSKKARSQKHQYNQPALIGHLWIISGWRGQRKRPGFL